MRSSTIFVPGKAVGKGSMRGFPNPKTGGVIMTASNARLLKPWESVVRLAASREWPGEPAAGPMAVKLFFTLLRPKSHYGTGKNATVIKASAPTKPAAKKDDLDKLVRAILDGMTSVAFQDDGQVVWILATKEYGNSPGVEIHVRELE